MSLSYKVSLTSNEDARQLGKLLTEYYREYHALVIKVTDIIQKCREVVALINARQPLVKRKEPHQGC